MNQREYRYCLTCLLLCYHHIHQWLCQGSADHIAWKYPSGCFGCCCSDRKEEGDHDIFFTIMGSLIKDVMNIKMATIELGSRDGRGSFLFHRLGLGREGQGQKSRGRGGKGKGSKSVGRWTYYVIADWNSGYIFATFWLPSEHSLTFWRHSGYNLTTFWL